MNMKAWIDDTIPRTSYLYVYTIYWGDGIWYETCTISNIFISGFQIDLSEWTLIDGSYT